MTKKIIHSYSAMKTFNTCPRQYKALYVDRSHKRAPSPALDKGIRYHEALENTVRYGQSLPKYLKRWESLAYKLHEGGAQAEVKLATDREGNPCDFFDTDRAWLRGAIDVDWEQQSSCLEIDWKTGKVYPDPLQADVYATMKWAQNPDLRINFKLVFLDHDTVVPVHPDREAVNRVKDQLRRIEAEQTYPPRPCFACRFCPVTECEYNES